MAIDPIQAGHAARALAEYLAARSPEESANDWHEALRAARKQVAGALRDSEYLADMRAALERNGAHMLVFRHLLAPPMSQDQFGLQCGSWSKSWEKRGRGVLPTAAALANTELRRWLDHSIARWLTENRRPSRAEIKSLLFRTGALIATQQVATRTRTKLAQKQEADVVQRLLSMGWTRLPSRLLDTRAAVPVKSFMHKTRFATATTAPQEVDIACGLGETVVLAMECKVTNDPTNSVKRVNDVLKKASAWRAHWGSFVKTAALLQGVVAAKDVQRLLDDGVLVFWSHDLDSFSSWLNDQVD